ncbi:hypothetical protein [Paraburkholderia oxyphila]|uniref:hypothetical protein n=1 Tax=Paraburkholderia oxyphila TaxID=614212 RepID=UPI0012EEBB20|nr:hypothetical protein [Paraburkholderia oxyphila]
MGINRPRGAFIYLMKQEIFPSRAAAFNDPVGISSLVRSPFIRGFSAFRPHAISGAFKTRLSHLEIKIIGLYYTARWGISKTPVSELKN